MRFLALLSAFSVAILAGCASQAPSPKATTMQYSKSVQTSVPIEKSYFLTLLWLEKIRGVASIKSISDDASADVLSFHAQPELDNHNSVSRFIDYRATIHVDGKEIRYDFNIDQAFSLDYNFGEQRGILMGEEEPAYRSLAVTQSIYDAFVAKMNGLIESHREYLIAFGP